MNIILNEVIVSMQYKIASFLRDHYYCIYWNRIHYICVSTNVLMIKVLQPNWRRFSNNYIWTFHYFSKILAKSWVIFSSLFLNSDEFNLCFWFLISKNKKSRLWRKNVSILGSKSYGLLYKKSWLHFDLKVRFNRLTLTSISI